MKNYEKPVLVVETVVITDVIAASFGSTSPSDVKVTWK